MKLQFNGAARTVTGSCFLLTTKRSKILIDCGMFQGIGIEDKNYEGFRFNAEEIDYVIITHSHLDHCGMLPKLYKDGFRGKVFMTPPTRSVVEYMLLDSAKVQEIRYKDSQDQVAKYKGWKIKSAYSDAVVVSKPIYNTVDVNNLFNHFISVDFLNDRYITRGIKFSFLRVGHALGAASVLLSVNEGKGEKRLLFSGDIGNSESKLDNRFDYAKRADYVVMESLYGGVSRESRKETEENLLDSINKTLSSGGNVIIPTFTYQRSQELLFFLREAIENNLISNKVRVFLDSPLAINITNVYKKYYKYLNPSITKRFKSGESLFNHRNIVFVQKGYESKRIKKRRGSIILAGHGMCAGGRVLYHLIDNLEDKRSSVNLVGFQAEGTLGRELLDGKTDVIVNDVKLKVKAAIRSFPGFSAHASSKDLLSWLAKVNKKYLKKVFLVHAEESITEKFEKILEKKGYRTIVPEMGMEYEIV